MSWLDKFFTALAAPSATSSVQGLVTLTGDLAGNGSSAATPLVSNITGDITGYAGMSAPNGGKFTGNPKSNEFDGIPINVTTPTSSPTTIFSYTCTTGRLYSIRGIVRVQNGPCSANGAWEIDYDCVYNTTAGTLTATGAVTQKLNTSSFVLTFTAVGSNLVLTATDPGTGRRWTGRIYVAESLL